MQQVLRSANHSSGQPLEASVRARLQPVLAADLEAVRIHRDPDDARVAEGLRANAFTIGQDIYFAAGKYSPDSLDGFRLLAHELAHTMQQPRGPRSPFSTTLPTSAVGDASELQARDVAERVASGAPAPTSLLTAVSPRIQGDWLDDAAKEVEDTYDSAASSIAGVYGAATTAVGEAYDAGASAISGAGSSQVSAPVVASLVPGGKGDWHEYAQAIAVLIAGVDLALIGLEVKQTAIDEAGKYAPAGGDYGPQNALRHCLLAGLMTSHGWRTALMELGIGALSAPSMLTAFGATMDLRVRTVLMAHEWFGDDGCNHYGTGTTDSECDRHNNEVGISIGGLTRSDSDIIAAGKAALDRGALLMTPGPTDLGRTVSTAGWRTSPWMEGGPQQPDCSLVTKT